MIVELPGGVDPEVSARAVTLKARIEARCPGLKDVVVAFNALAIYFDPLVHDVEALENDVRSLGDDLPSGIATGPRVIEVPVTYGGEAGPDLTEVADRAGVSESTVISLHAGRSYRVYMLGFVAGFAYMAPVDPRIAFPRRDVPRERVPAGSVAIAAGQTGIYPTESPGGWHLIGRTALQPFDVSRAEPCLFRVGDEVRFQPVEC